MLGFVVCGLERSGTTLVSELFRQVPRVDAGFEIGVLLGGTPRDFLAIQPFSDNMLWNWGLTQDALAQCCDTDDFAAFYTKLLASSTVMRPGTAIIFDKTPRYLATLDDCMGKTPVPFIVTFKDPRSTVYSDFRASGAEDFDRWFEAYAPDKIGYMRLHYAQFERLRMANDQRALLVRLEDLCLQPGVICPRILAHRDLISITRIWRSAPAATNSRPWALFQPVCHSLTSTPWARRAATGCGMRLPSFRCGSSPPDRTTDETLFTQTQLQRQIVESLHKRRRVWNRRSIRINTDRKRSTPYFSASCVIRVHPCSPVVSSLLSACALGPKITERRKPCLCLDHRRYGPLRREGISMAPSQFRAVSWHGFFPSLSRVCGAFG